jgi:hypothetical protein
VVLESDGSLSVVTSGVAAGSALRNVGAAAANGTAGRVAAGG